MKKFLPALSGTIAVLQLFAIKAFAASGGGAFTVPDIKGLQDGGGDSESIIDIIVKVVEVILDFVTLLAVIFVIVAGIRLIVSGGDEGEKDKAKKTVIYAVVGLIIVIFARVIVQFAISLVTGSN